ncbi:uncharacterized protein LOC141914324 [Tubulanus polymorphus]|uniref:uncharacterized protein LOC141914324 n=1 Tax=Tubulanus polymorphus TaxID=672921 RepID=UPI003DA58ACB
MISSSKFHLISAVFAALLLVVNGWHCYTCVGDESVSENALLPELSPGYFQSRINMKRCLDPFTPTQLPTCSEEDVQNVVGTVCVKEVFQRGDDLHVIRRCAVSCEPPKEVNGYWLNHYSCCWGHYCNGGDSIRTRSRIAAAVVLAVASTVFVSLRFSS